ncbi:MAG: hypothetical protein Q7K29_08150 [Thermoleophilia bacterium]|nr:hypothetical protein [Thermoleophilia bacterium]
MAAMLVAQMKGRLDRMQVKGVDYGGNALPDQAARIRVDTDLGSVGNLLDTDD